jgi:metal-responsive CopG/Arc/MetJ family transcriptional regulator
MKPIQVTFDEDLLAELDERPEVRERGRSAVLREAAAAYLVQRRTEDIERQYEQAYTRAPQSEAEVAEWEGVQAWGEE